ncbi:MAG: dihydroneopterin aldolase [Methylobacterium mesophilicum]|nr:dihydroneopterin aldolase [Methylobacterium mesophilicum]
MYLIRLKNCAFFACHGVLVEEASLGQRFFIDVELHVDAPEALVSDKVEKTVHYGEVFKLIESIATERRFNLIEAMAYEAGREILSRFPATRTVTVTVRKPSVPIVGILDHAEVSVTLP